jgi:uncharacterized membrane protein YbhN (UPF0104 family)
MSEQRDTVPISSTLPRLGWRRALLAIAIAAVVAAGVATLIGKAAGFGEVLDLLRAADKGWLLVCFAAIVVEYAAYTVVLRRSVRFEGGPDPGLGLSARVTLGSLGATHITAAAGAGGLVVTFWCFRRLGFGRGDAFRRLLGLNTLVYFAYGLAGFFAALVVVLRVHGEAPLAITLPWLTVVPLCLLAGWWVTQPARVGRLSRVRGSILRRLLGFAIGGTAWMRRLLGSPEGNTAFAAAGTYWAGDIACFWASQRAFDVRLPLSVVVLAYATGYAAMFVPLPLFNVGGVDAAMTFALVAVGVPLANALLAVVVFRLFAFWLMVIPSGVFLALLPRTGRALDQVARQARAGDEPAMATP